MKRLVTRAKQSPAGRFATAWGELHAGDGATLIAWQLLFSLFPLVIGLLAIVGFVLRDPARLTSIANAIAGQFPEQASDLVAFIYETRDLGGIFGVVSIVGLLWSGSNLFGVMARVFNRFYGVEDRGFIGQRVTAFAMMVVYAVLVTVSVGATSITGFLVGLSENLPFLEVGYLGLALGWALSFGSAFVMFLALYRVVPNAGLHLKTVWPGTVVAAVMFVVLTQVFPIYLSFLGGGFAAYKALGVFLLLMTWFNFLALILCVGALLNAVLANRLPASPAAVTNAAVAPAASGNQDAAAVRRPDADDTAPFKVMAWAGLTAAMSGLVLVLMRRMASVLWRRMTGQPPPVR